jgi:hypothetical protein
MEEQIEVTKCLLSLGAESFVFQLFCKGVKLGQNKKDQPAPTANALSKLLHL